MHSFNLGLRVYYNILHLFLVVFLNVPSVFKPKLLFFLDVYFNINHCNIAKPQIILLLKELNPFAPGDFAEKRVLKLVKWFSGHCHAIKS